MKDLIKQNYEVTKARGLITNKTSIDDFMNKIIEEYNELELECYIDPEMFIETWSYNDLKVSKSIKKGITFELADIILVCLNFAKHYDIDIEQALKEKIEINRQRIVY